VPNSRADVRPGGRFSFGRNWRSFIELVDHARIEAAVESLTGPLGVADLSGRTFLDIGCGSGLFSLAAHRLGARVRAFDFDPDSVTAATELRRRFAPDSDWTIERGSILDPAFVRGMGRFDVVYSWGVLHHTGRMWAAMEATAGLVAPGGLLLVAIYNDQGRASRIWCRVKRRYNASGPLMRRALLLGSRVYLRRGRPVAALSRALRGGVARPPRRRGMSAEHDLIDWVGGFPFEVAKPEEVFDFVRRLGFDLRHLRTCGGGLGCNEYVFERGEGTRRSPESLSAGQPGQTREQVPDVEGAGQQPVR
jgi:SAM-dependent methyltransferase